MRLSTDDERLAYLQMLAADARPDQYIDLRWMPRGGWMRRRFVPACELERAADLIERLAPHADVYVGVALREGDRHGGRSAIGAGHLLHLECDRPGVRCRLASFAHPPTMVIASGSPGHLHAYWHLSERAPGGDIEWANRMLALALGGDLASIDLVRVLRPPATLNHKLKPAAPVSLLEHRPQARYRLTQLLAALPTPPRPSRQGASAARRSRARTALDRRLRAIPAAHYAQVLTGREPDRRGKLACPFHEDRHPSLHLYEDGTFYCFGCGAGGSIYDFAARLWGIAPRGLSFLHLRERLRALFPDETERI